MALVYAGQLERAVAVALNIGVTGGRVPLGALMKFRTLGLVGLVEQSGVGESKPHMLPRLLASV